MKYSSLIEFEPLTTIIKLADATDEKLKHNVETYVFSEQMTEKLLKVVVPRLSVEPCEKNTEEINEKMGVSVVGSYGTGKSHLMSVISAVAENASMLQYVNNDSVKQAFKSFAGHYKVLRFDIPQTIDFQYFEIFRLTRKNKLRFPKSPPSTVDKRPSTNDYRPQANNQTPTCSTSR